MRMNAGKEPFYISRRNAYRPFKDPVGVSSWANLGVQPLAHDLTVAIAAKSPILHFLKI